MIERELRPMQVVPDHASADGTFAMEGETPFR